MQTPTATEDSLYPQIPGIQGDLIGSLPFLESPELGQQHETFDSFQPGATVEDLEAIGHLIGQMMATTLRPQPTRGLPPPVSALDVPHDYRLYSSSCDHYTGLEAWADWIEDPCGDFEFIENGSISDHRKVRRFFGFDPVELIRSGALHCSPCRPNDLSVPIHPILGYKNFINCDEKVYRELEPSLRLATVWLTHTACRSFWTTLLFGHRSVDFEETMNSDGVLAFRIQRFNMKPTQHNYQLYDLYMSQLAQHISFEFSKEIWDERCYGVAHKVPCQPELLMRDGHPWAEHSRIQLMSDFYTQAAKFAAVKYPDEACRLRFRFFTAVNICHEIAHCIESKVHTTYLMKFKKDLGPQTFQMLIDTFQFHPSREAFFEEQSINEMGLAWECDFFGGKLQPINCRCDSLHGLYVSPQDQTDWLNQKSYSVPNGFIEEMQQQSFWDRFQDVRIPRGFFKVPLIGAVGMKTITFTTQPLRDWLLEQESQEGRLGAEDKAILFVNGSGLPVPTSTGTLQRRFLPGKAILNNDTSTLRKEETKRLAARKAIQLAQTLLQPYSTIDVHEADCFQRGQKLLTDYFVQSTHDATAGDASQDRADVALKDHAQLTTADKWYLTEEHFCLSCGYSPLTFLGLRASRQFSDLPKSIAPWVSTSWQKPQIEILLNLRKEKGRNQSREGQPDAHDRVIERIAQKWQWVEELAVYDNWTRLDYYKMRAAGNSQLWSNPRFNPLDGDSWSQNELCTLLNKRNAFEQTAQKWRWFEEYANLVQGMSRAEFLLCKHQNLWGFSGQNALFDPGNSKSWGPQQIKSLEKLRYELSPLRKTEKWGWANKVWMLFRETNPDSADSWQDFIAKHPEWDPDLPDSWQTEHVEALHGKVTMATRRAVCTVQTGELVEQNNTSDTNMRKITAYFKFSKGVTEVHSDTVDSTKEP